MLMIESGSQDFDLFNQISKVFFFCFEALTFKLFGKSYIWKPRSHHDLEMRCYDHRAIKKASNDNLACLPISVIIGLDVVT